MGIVIDLEPVRERHAVKRAARMLVSGCCAGSAGAGDRRVAEMICLTDRHSAMELAQRALYRAGRSRDTLGVAGGHFTLGVLAAARGDWSMAHLHGRLAAELDADRLAETYLLLGMSSRRCGELGESGHRFLRDALLMAREVDDSALERLVLLERTMVALMHNDPAPAWDNLKRLVDVQPADDLQARWQTFSLAAWAARLEGNNHVLLPTVCLASELVDQTRDNASLILAFWILGEHLAREGQVEGAAACLQQLRRHFVQWLGRPSDPEETSGGVLGALVLQEQVLMACAQMTEIVESLLPDTAASLGRLPL